MPDVNTEIGRYQYEFRSVPGENVAVLYLFDKKGKDVAMVAFVDNTEPLPSPRESIGGLVLLTYRRHDMAGFIDLLRNEKPSYFTWASAQQVARITTAREPVGEEEFRSFWSTLFP